METKLALFEGKEIRKVWSIEKSDWLFSVIDVIEVLTESPRPRKYWNALKTELIKDGSEVSQNMGQLKLKASDGKMRLTDVGNTPTILRLIQSIPSKKEIGKKIISSSNNLGEEKKKLSK